MKRFAILFLMGLSFQLFAEEPEIEPVAYGELKTLILEGPAMSPPELKLPYKRAWLAVGLSSVFPGLGHLYLGDYRTAGELGGISAGVSLAGGSQESLLILQNTWMYGLFAAYRDARVYNSGSSYRYRMPIDSFADLSLAPFRPRVMKKMEVWGGILGFLVLQSAVGYFGFPMNASAASEATHWNPVFALPVGIGEEALFRGYLQPALSEAFTPWGGIVLSTAAFTAVHIPNAKELDPKDQWRYYAYVLPLIGTFSVYSGWLTYKNNSLQESVAIHSWYDFVLFLGGALSQSSIKEKKLKFATGIGF